MSTQNENETFLNGSTFDVRLLLSDLQEAKKISSVFRMANIIPHVYEEFSEFYKDSAISKNPSLCIIDIKKMSQGMIKLKGHPGLVNQTLHLAFYYTDETMPLLFSTYEILNFGLIRKTDDYAGPIKSILQRYNLYKSLDHQISILNDELMDIRNTQHKTFSLLEEQREKNFYQEKLLGITKLFENEKKNISFFESCEDVFEHVDEIVQFSYMELSPNGLKLLSPPSSHRKFQKMPSLWIGGQLTDGIELFAQNMANQVALEIFGPEVMCLHINGRKSNPDGLLFIKVSTEEFLNHLNWDYLEAYLGNINCYFLARKISEGQTAVGLMDGFSFLEKLDELRFYEQKKESLYLVDVCLNNLAKLISHKPEIRFYWKDFYQDFIRSFKSQFIGDFYYTVIPSSHISFLVDQSKGDILLRQLKEYTRRFSYWRYFEDRDHVFTRDIEITVRSLPVSSHAYLSYVNDVNNVYHTSAIRGQNSSYVETTVQ